MSEEQKNNDKEARPPSSPCETRPEDDPYSRVDYRRMVAWPRRIKRESPFLRQVLADIPIRSVIDLGCGSGEHSRFLAAEGYSVVGLDRSDSMLAKASEQPLPLNLQFLRGDLQDLSTVVENRFGAAICLGNTLVHLTEEEDLRRAVAGVAKILEDNGVLLFQILNYEPVFEGTVRHLPLNFRPEKEGGQAIFLRLMEPLEDDRVRFCPSTLKYDPELDPPLRVVRSRIVELRGWRQKQLLPLLESVGLGVEEIYGDMEAGPFAPSQSQDLIVVARKQASAAPHAG